MPKVIMQVLRRLMPDTEYLLLCLSRIHTNSRANSVFQLGGTK